MQVTGVQCVLIRNLEGFDTLHVATLHLADDSFIIDSTHNLTF